MKHSEIMAHYRAATSRVKAGNAKKHACITVDLCSISKEINKPFHAKSPKAYMRDVRISSTIIRREHFVPPTC